MIAKRNKIPLDWEEIDRLVDILCEKIITQIPSIDSVMGLPRGGLIPAVMVSHRLGLPLVTLPEPHTLVIDDIADSGVTLTNTPGIYTAVLHYKPHTSVFKPDLYSVEYKGDDFLVYPWEHEDAEPIADYLKK
jgi:hypoxanthine phosphoribosyltransferase|tara:strand:- start:319 stop:717 length:399 start_codon:yes stop_codon:yes gene_type:complete